MATLATGSSPHNGQSGQSNSHPQFDMVAKLRLTEKGETIISEDKQSRENNLINENEIEDNNIVTLHVHMMNDNTIAMMGKMNIKLPTPAHFDGKNPQFNEWAGEAKAYLTIHDDNYTAEDYIKLNNKFPAVSADDTDEYEEYNEMTMNIRKKNDDIASFRMSELCACTFHKGWE
eukprot:2954061-Amphidinium_carterae.2